MLLVIFFCFFVTELRAQKVVPEVTNIVPPSIEVSSLGNYGDFDKNLATGQLGLNVPVYVLEGRSLKYPLSISYNSSGIQVNSRSTSVGLNWSALGAGVITKTVIGVPDDQKVGAAGYNQAYLYGNEFNTTVYSPKSFDDHVLKAARGAIDMEPDFFSFSFNGRSGKFYYDPATAEYYTMPYSKLIITKDTGSESGEFQITDEKGYSYTFGRSADTFNDFGTSPEERDMSVRYTSQWYLTKVMDPDGNTEFNLEYIDDKLVTENISTSESLSYVFAVDGPCGAGTTDPVMNFSSGSSTYSNTLRKGLLLSKINGPLESIALVYKDRLDGSMRLDSVSFFANGVQKNYWKFYQSYYAGAIKLRLDSMSQYANGKKIQVIISPMTTPLFLKVIVNHRIIGGTITES